MTGGQSSHRPRLRAGVLLAALLSITAMVRAQQSPGPASADDAAGAADFSDPYFSAPANDEPGVQGLERLQRLPPDAFGDNPPGIPYSQVLNTTGADVNDINIIGGHPVNLDFRANPQLENVEGSVLFSPGNPNFTVPFLRHGTEPDNANIKAGPFFITFHSLDGLVLYDDNYNGSRNDRKSELLVLLRLNLTVVAQLADNLQFVLSGDLGFLPLNNEFGIFGVENSLYSALGLLGAGPIFAAQFIDDTVIAGWPVRFADDFRAGAGVYSADVRDNYDLFQEDYLQRDSDGRYSFATEGARPNQDNSSFINSQNDSLIYFDNTVSALTDRLLPGDVRLTVRVDHDNLWYNQDNRGLPPSRDDFYASLVSERENERFKPYASYEAVYVENDPGITQIVRGGFFGPIDDQVFLRAEIGYYIAANGHQNALYRLDLEHAAGPYTSERLVLDRDLNYFYQEQRTSEYYSLDQTLGPTLVASLFAAHSSYQELENDGLASRSENIGGVQLVWYMGPKTTLQLGSVYERQAYADGLKTHTLSSRVILNRIVTDTLTFQLLYEYQHFVENRHNDSYYDNIVYFRIIKFLE